MAESQSLTPEISKRDGVALCLSGGGYRATLFHLGAVRRLNELGVLSKLKTITSVSGGSILNGMLAAHLTPWPTSGGAPAFDDVAERVCKLTRRNIRWIPSFHWVERAYRRN